MNRTENNFGVQSVGELLDELRFDGELLVEQRQVVLQLGVLRDDDTFAERVKLRPTRTAHHLHDVLETKLVPTTLFGVVHLRALDDHGVRGQVDPPRERRRGDEHLNVTVAEELLY